MLNKEGFNAWADGYDRSTARSAAGKVAFIQSLLPLLREGGTIYIGDVAFAARGAGGVPGAVRNPLGQGRGLFCL